LVDYLLWEQEVEGSSPSIQTKLIFMNKRSIKKIYYLNGITVDSKPKRKSKRMYKKIINILDSNDILIEFFYKD
jgi:hypothetical protein